jgi:hypothetical protein
VHGGFAFSCTLHGAAPLYDVSGTETHCTRAACGCAPWLHCCACDTEPTPPSSDCYTLYHCTWRPTEGSKKVHLMRMPRMHAIQCPYAWCRGHATHIVLERRPAFRLKGCWVHKLATGVLLHFESTRCSHVATGGPPLSDGMRAAPCTRVRHQLPRHVPSPFPTPLGRGH